MTIILEIVGPRILSFQTLPFETNLLCHQVEHGKGFYYFAVIMKMKSRPVEKIKFLHRTGVNRMEIFLRYT